MSDTTLAPRAEELRRQGFELVEESEDRLLAVRRRWHWELMLSYVVAVVWVQRVAVLSAERLEADGIALQGLWRDLDPSSWPPGLQKGRLALGVYVVEDVEPEARAALERQPSAGFGTAAVWAALLGDERIRYRVTPAVGMLLFHPLEHLLDRLRVPPRGPAQFTSPAGQILSAFIAGGLALLVLSVLLAVATLLCSGAAVVLGLMVSLVSA